MAGISDSRVVTATSVLLDTEPPRRKSVSALHSRPTYARSPHLNPPDLSWFSGWRVGSSGRRIRVQLIHTSSTHVRPLPLEFAIEVVRGLNSSLHLILSACIVPKTYVFVCRGHPAERKHVLKNTRQKNNTPKTAASQETVSLIVRIQLLWWASRSSLGYKRKSRPDKEKCAPRRGGAKRMTMFLCYVRDYGDTTVPRR